MSPAYGFSALALVKCSNEECPGPRHNMKEDPGTSTLNSEQGGKDSKTNDRWEASTVQDMQNEMDNATTMTRRSGYYPPTWRTSLITASKTSKQDHEGRAWARGTL